MGTFDIAEIIWMLAATIIMIAICASIVQIVKAICQAITKGIEIRTFGSSEQYREFLQWKKDREAYR